MKHFSLVLYSLFIINTLSAMDNEEKQITIHNVNYSTTSDSYGVRGVDVNLKWYDEFNKLVGCHIGGNELMYGQKKNFSLQKNGKHSLRFPNTISQEVILNVTHDGKVAYNDTITIIENEKTVIIANEKTSCTLYKTNIPLTIGSYLSIFPVAVDSPPTRLTITNKDLALIQVVYKALREKSSDITKFIYNNLLRNDFPCHHSKEAKIQKNDTQVQKNSYYLRSGESTTITTLSSPNILKNLIKLVIFQAAQSKINVIVNDGNIKSGDTLNISLCLQDNTILIKNQHENLLVKLYSQKFNTHTLTLG